MKEIGGYFEFENLINNELYKDCLAFNSARNCLRYIIQKRMIKKMYLPYFLCEVIADACKKENIDIEYYNIGIDFLPILEKEKINENSYLYIINYYGLLDNDKIKDLKKEYKYLIVDNTHAFYQKPVNDVDTIYNCRKYFGVPDGAYLVTDLELDNNISYSVSGFRTNHLIGRYERNASDYYEIFKKADESFKDEDIMLMSKFTKNLMGAIDYDKVLKIRKNNIKYLDDCLKKYNKLNFDINNMNFMYPLYIDDAEGLKKELINNKIYIPVLWPNVFEFNNQYLEYDLVQNILPIPIDQRYNIEDMKRIIDIIQQYMKGSL